MSAQSDIWQKAYADFHFNLCEESSFEIAGGYKFNPFVGLGLKMEFFGYRTYGLGLHFRGTNLSLDSPKSFGYYYTAALGVASGENFEKKTFSQFNIGAGLRYERLGLGLGYRNTWRRTSYSEQCLQFKISYFPTDYRPQTSILSRIFQKRGDQKDRALYFHFLMGYGHAKADVIPLIYGYNGINLNIGLGYQLGSDMGVGLGLHTSGSGGLGSRYNISSIGASFNGYANIFYYNVLAGPVINFSLVDDFELPRQKFKKEKSMAGFLQLQGGVRLFRLLTIGGSIHVSTPIKGLYTKIDDPFEPEPVIVLEERRKSSYYGYNFLVGFTF